jgi:hypothetical protein
MWVDGELGMDSGGILGIRGTVRDSGDFRSSHALFLTKKSRAGLIMKL